MLSTDMHKSSTDDKDFSEKNKNKASLIKKKSFLI